MYTSGTTGQPKGAMITHGNIVATVHNLMLLIPMGPDSGMLAMAPLFHVGAMALVLGTLATGGRVVILPAFTPTAVFDAIEAQAVPFTRSEARRLGKECCSMFRSRWSQYNTTKKI